MAKEMEVEWNIDRRTSRLTANQQHRVNVPANTFKQQRRKALFLLLVDHLMKGCWNRVIDSSGNMSTPQSSTYSIHIQQTGSFATSPATWQSGSFLMAKLLGGSQSGSSLLHKTNQLCKIPCATRLRSCIRNAIAILTIILTMPVSIATPERSFSCMRRVKTYLRSNFASREILRDRTSTCIQGNKHRRASTQTRSSRTFAQGKPRRLAFEIWTHIHKPSFGLKFENAPL